MGTHAWGMTAGYTWSTCAQTPPDPGRPPRPVSSFQGLVSAFLGVGGQLPAPWTTLALSLRAGCPCRGQSGRQVLSLMVLVSRRNRKLPVSLGTCFVSKTWPLSALGPSEPHVVCSPLAPTPLRSCWIAPAPPARLPFLPPSSLPPSLRVLHTYVCIFQVTSFIKM